MQEEVEDKAVNLAIQSSSVTVKGICKGVQAYIRYRKNKNLKKSVRKDSVLHGEQSLKELVGQGQGVSSIPVVGDSIKNFKKLCNKYGADFAIIKDKTVDPPQYTCFFKAKDVDAITQVVHEYTLRQAKRQKKPSILQKLRKFKELVANMDRKDREKKKEQER